MKPTPWTTMHWAAIPWTCSLACALLLASTGCVSIAERYYIKATSLNQGEPAQTNYFRVDVSGWTSFSASQYAAGWYDRDAVDQLFGEVTGSGKRVSIDNVTLAGHYRRRDGAWIPYSTPATGGGNANVENGSSETNGGDGGSKGSGGSARPTSRPTAPADPAKVTSLEGGILTDKKLVLFLSTNADSLVNQLGILATNSVIQLNLTALVLGADVERLEAQKSAAAESAADSGQLAARLEAIASALEGLADTDNDGVTKQALAALRVLAKSTPSFEGTDFKDAAKALDWYVSHPEAFATTGGAK